MNATYSRNGPCVLLALLVVALLAGCELLGTDEPDLHVETERDEFVVGQGTALAVTVENVSDQTLYYSSCLDVQLEKLHGWRVVETAALVRCECICATGLAPGENTVFELDRWLVEAVQSVRHEPDAAYRLRFAFYTDDELRDLLAESTLRSNRFRITAALNAWTDAGRLLLENTLDRPLAYFALEAETAQTVRLGPPSSWPHLTAGENIAIPYDSLMGYGPGDERAVVYWSDEDELQGSLSIDLD